nr:YdaS family helix-turn-helix protein [Massilia sp. Leaf139]
MTSMSADKDLIESLGGPAKLAARLGCSVQRVQNWKERGIPPRVRLDNPDVFPLPQPHGSKQAEPQGQ